MVLRRILGLLQRGDWFTVILEVFVLVLGIFLGFQVDRLYEDRQVRAEVAGQLEAIAEDFAENRVRLETAIGYATAQVEAAMLLRSEGRAPGGQFSTEELNRAFSVMSGLPTFEAVDFGYQSLLASGGLTVLGNQQVIRELAGFYAAYQLTRTIQSSQELQYVTLLQPYMIRHLDYAASMRPGGADEGQRSRLYPLGNPELIREAITTQEFSNIVASQWERAIDLQDDYEGLLERVTRIETLLVQSPNRPR